MPNFHQLVSSLIHNKKLFQGWKKLSTVATAQYLRAVSNLVCRKAKLNPHISAADLEILKSPTLLKHKSLSPNDKKIWDAAYAAEYYGLEGIDTWETITEEEYQVRSLNWLAISTRPDIATAVNLLAKHMGNHSSGHLVAAKRVLRYLKGTPDLGIAFHSRRNQQMEAFLKFPLTPHHITSFADANWGPQDASVPKKKPPSVSLDLFKSRSLSGFLIWHTGPIHWMSKRQSITARSSAEAEIYATDECCKTLQHLANIIDDMDLKTEIIK